MMAEVSFIEYVKENIRQLPSAEVAEAGMDFMDKSQELAALLESLRKPLLDAEFQPAVGAKILRVLRLAEELQKYINAKIPVLGQ
jgi:hypothetical protein